MTLPQRNHTKSDVDDRTERLIVLRGKWIAQVNTGPGTKWIDLFTVREVKGMLQAVRAARAEADARYVTRQQREVDASLAARRARDRRRYNREMERLRGGKTQAEINAERQAARLARMSPKQIKDHESYMRRREQILEQARAKTARLRAERMRNK